MNLDSAARYRFLLKINNALVSETSRHGVFTILARELGSVINYDRFSINLYDRETNSLSYFASAQGISPAGISEDERPLAKGAIASQVIRSRRPLIIKDLSRHTYWESARAMRAAGLNATMAFPLIVRDEVLGVAHISFMEAPPDFEEMAEFLIELSAQAAIAVDHMLAYTTLKNINEQLKKQKEFLASQESYGEGSRELFYESRAMARVIGQAEMLADSDASVVITGETGTGKDLLARFIHQRSPRREALFVKVNCPALTSSLFESELFGHAKGAFTGAQTDRVGRFEMADGGTIFLDEIGDLSAPLQAKLLHVLQDRAFERVGESRSIKADFRLLSATNKNLEESLKNRSFRSDLFYRLNTMTLHMPPLRERLEDVPILVQNLAAAQAVETHRPSPIFTEHSLKVMSRYSWPGNVRELKNLVKRLGIMRPGERITGRDIETVLSEVPDRPQRGQVTLAEAEKRCIEQALRRTGGRVGGPSGAAAILGLPRQTLQYRMKKYGLKAGG